MCKGIGIDYTEKIVQEHNVKTEIMYGWSISRLSKVSPSMIYKKWKHAIDAMEK